MTLTAEVEAEAETETAPAVVQRQGMSWGKRTAIGLLGAFSVFAVAPVVTSVVAPQASPQASAAAPEKRCWKMIAFRGPIEVPCVAKPLTQAQRECLIGLGVAVMIDVGTGGVIGGPAVVAAAVACGVKFLSTPV